MNRASLHQREGGAKAGTVHLLPFLPIALALSVIGSSVSAIGLVSDVMDATDAGLTVGGGTTGLAFTAPVLILVQAISAIILFVFWRMALRSSAGPFEHLSKLVGVIGLILLATGIALELVVFVLQISIDAGEHATTFVSLRALEAFGLIGFAAGGGRCFLDVHIVDPTSKVIWPDSDSVLSSRRMVRCQRYTLDNLPTQRERVN